MKRVLYTAAFFMLVASALPESPAVAPAAELLTFSDAELRAILSHGPWPIPPARDPSNRVSGNPEAMDLGEHLFFDRRLSGTGRFSCSSCHVPDRSWTDNRRRGAAVSEIDRNTPSLNDVRLNRWFGWGGAADSLWAQSIRPILDPRELGSSPQAIAALVRSDATLSCRYRKTFGSTPSATDDEGLLVDIAKALAAFQETFQSPRAPFDEFRDALARGDRQAAARYPVAAQRGLKVFVASACSTCHTGPNFTNGEFHDIGLPHFAAPGRVDSGRYEGVKEVKASRYNLLGSYNDDAGHATATSTRHVALEHRNFGEFKVPSLRSAAFTAPYGHDGQLATLADVVRHYSDLNLDRLHADGERLLKPLRLSAREQKDLVSFIESLSPYGNSWRPGPWQPCD